MQLLEERIRRDGKVLPGNVLKINSFLNHQVDPALMMALGIEFAKRFKDSGVTKILTCEASGIAPAVMAGYQLNVPVIFARKKQPSTINEATYTAPVASYTKGVTNTICVEQQFLPRGEQILIIDDFLARGEAVKGMASITQQAGCSVVGIGVVVAKNFQGGTDWVKAHGYPLESLATISNFAGKQIHFEGEA